MGALTPEEKRLIVEALQRQAVTVIPQGQSAIPLPVWSEERKQLVLPEGAGQISGWRVARRNAAAGHKAASRRLQSEMRERRAHLVRIHTPDMTKAEAAAALGCSLDTARIDAKALGLVFRPIRPPVAPEVVARRKAVAAAARRGVLSRAAAEELAASNDCSFDCIRGDARLQGLKVEARRSGRPGRSDPAEPRTPPRAVPVPLEALRAAVAEDGITWDAMAARFGVAPITVQRWVKAAGLQKAPCRGIQTKSIDTEAFRRLYMDDLVPWSAIEAKVGMSRRALRERARAMGLPPRRVSGDLHRSGSVSKIDPARLRALIAEGLSPRELEAVFDCSRSALNRARLRLEEADGAPCSPKTARRQSGRKTQEVTP